MKTCFKCGDEKPPTDFYRHPQMTDGRLNKCKECTRGDVRKNRRRRREYYIEYDRERFKNNPKRRQSTIMRALERKKKNPVKARAWNAVSNAVRDGRLDKPEICEHCKQAPRRRLEAHHHDYTKPLDVTWLCTDCHAAVHSQAA